MASRDTATKYEGQQNGRRGAKDIAKVKGRRRERDRDHEIVQRYNAGQHNAGED